MFCQWFIFESNFASLPRLWPSLVLTDTCTMSCFSSQCLYIDLKTVEMAPSFIHEKDHIRNFQCPTSSHTSIPFYFIHTHRGLKWRVPNPQFYSQNFSPNYVISKVPCPPPYFWGEKRKKQRKGKQKGRILASSSSFSSFLHNQD